METNIALKKSQKQLDEDLKEIEDKFKLFMENHGNIVTGFITRISKFRGTSAEFKIVTDMELRLETYE